VTVAVGTVACTVTLALPVTFSALALIVTVPTFTPVTLPVDDTVAMVLSPDVQVKARPLSTLPDESRAMAFNVVAVPMPTVAVGGEIEIEAIGTGTTVTLAVPDLSSLVAVIVTGPPRTTPVTSPLLETVAIALFDELQTTDLPVSVFPAASLSVA
jgi:hypothetical protein